MKYKMVVSDFDWTLGNSPDHIEESTVRAIRAYEQKGGIFTVCTGRLYSSIVGILKKHGFHGFVIACQGAIIADIDTGERIYSDGIDTAVAARVEPFFKRCLTEMDDKDIAIVSHGGIIRVLLCLFLGVDLNNIWNFSVGNCSKSTLAKWRGFTTVLENTNATYYLR